MSEFHLSIVTPERMFFDGEAERVVVRTISGDVGILKGHAKYISALGTGALKIKFSDGEKIAALSGGFIKADREKTLILATTCEWKDEIDLERAKRAEEKAREREYISPEGAAKAEAFYELPKNYVNKYLSLIHI